MNESCLLKIKTLVHILHIRDREGERANDVHYLCQRHNPTAAHQRASEISLKSNA